MKLTATRTSNVMVILRLLINVTTHVMRYMVLGSEGRDAHIQTTYDSYDMRASVTTTHLIRCQS